MNRRFFCKAVLGLPAVALLPLKSTEPGVQFLDGEWHYLSVSVSELKRRYSVEMGDPGEKDYWDLRREGKDIEVYLDGIRLDEVVTVDLDENMIVRYVPEEWLKKTGLQGQKWPMMETRYGPGHLSIKIVPVCGQSAAPV